MARPSAIILLFFVFLHINNACGENLLAKPEEKSRLITISEGIEMTLKDSRSIKTALPDKDMAFADSLLLRSVLLPRVNVTATKSFFSFQPMSKIDAQRVSTAEKQPLSYGFDAYQTLFDFGKSLSGYKASKEALKAREANIESVKRLAVLEFITAYFNFLEAEKMIMVAEKEVESVAAYLSDSEHLYEQGSAVKNDLLPAQVRLADAKQKLISARNDKEIAAARLNNILSLPLREKIEAQDIEMKTPEFPDMEQAWDNAQKLRPEITFFEGQIRSSALNEKAKAVENFPTIFAGAGYSYTQNKYQVHEANSYIELGAKFDLYDGGVAKAKLLKEQANQKQLQEEKNKLVEDIKFEIEDSYLGLKNACEKTLVAKDAVMQAEENVRFNRVKYNAGNGTSTDVLEAITLETVARTNYHSSDYELKRNYAKLMYSMGIDLTLIYERMENENGHGKQ